MSRSSLDCGWPTPFQPKNILKHSIISNKDRLGMSEGMLGSQGLAPPDRAEENMGALDGSYEVSAPCYHNNYILSQRFQVLTLT